MPSSTVPSKNDFTVVAFTTGAVSLANAPASEGVIVVMAAIYTGSAGGSFSVVPTGGTGVSVQTLTDLVSGVGEARGVATWVVKYATPPTALEITRDTLSGGSTPRIAGSCINVAGHRLPLVGSTGANDTDVTAFEFSCPTLTNRHSRVLGIVTKLSSGGTITKSFAPWTEVMESNQDNVAGQACNIITIAPNSTGSFAPSWDFNASDTFWAASVIIPGKEQMYSRSGSIVIANGGVAF